jgi:hypothetical protein
LGGDDEDLGGYKSGDAFPLSIVDTAGPSPTLRFGRDDKVKGNPPPCKSSMWDVKEERRPVGCGGTPLKPKPGLTLVSCTLHQATAACAAFSKESRMKFINANRLHRKSGAWGPQTFVARFRLRGKFAGA